MKGYLKTAVILFCIGCSTGCTTSGKVSHDGNGVISPKAAGSGKVIRIGGKDADIAGFIMPVTEIFEEETGIALTTIHSGPGVVDLTKGTADIIISEQSLEDLLEETALQKVAIDPSLLHQVEIGHNNSVVFLNRKNKVKKLTKKQLKAIFTGKITNWKKLGGADRSIVVIWNSSAAADDDPLMEEILDGAPMSAKAVAAGSYEEVRARVTATPGAIALAPRGFVVSGVKVAKTPTVVSPVIMVTKGEPSPDLKKLIQLLKEVDYLQ